MLTTLGATPAALQLQTYLNKNFTLNPPIAVPFSAIQKGFTYSMQATLCNFLGSCSSAVKSVTVLSSVSAVPVVSILGQSQRSVYSAAQLVLNSNAYTPSCSGAVSSSNLEYTWTVRRLNSDGTLTATAQRSRSQSPTVFKLPAYTLDVSTQYEVTLSVKSLASGLSSSATVSVSVLQGIVVATVAGGTTRNLKVQDSLQLDASQSYDEDVPSKRGAAAGLAFLWTCVQIKPVFSVTCVLTTPADMLTEKITVVAPVAAASASFLFTVTVGGDIRSSSVQVEVVVTADPTPTMEITNERTTLANINTGKQLVLYGSLVLFEPCAASWSVDDSNIMLSDVARTPLFKYVLPSNQAAVPLNLVLAENSLPQRATLVFSLTCGFTSTSVSVTTNGSPLPGEFSVTPPSGDELSTTFTFTAMQWSDPDLPLTYQFGFQSATSLSNLVVVRISEVSSARTTLPAGRQDPALLNMINCTLNVYDNIGAAISLQEAVIVHRVSPAEKETLLAKLLQSNTGSIDSTKNIISVVSSALSSVNCSAVLNCTSLNRSPCFRTSGECGPCLSGYIGDAGDRSTLCVSAQELRSNSTDAACSTALECPFAWLVCDLSASTCVPPPKSCSWNCSHHGECIYVNRITGDIQPTCRLDNLDCEGVCSCVDQFSGAFCEKSVASLRTRRELRSSLLESLHNLTAVEDVNAESVSAWSASLYTLSIHPYELSTKDVSAVAAIANTTLHSAIALGIDSFVNILGVLNAVDTVASLLRYNYNPNDYNSVGFNSTRRYVNNTAAAVVHTVSAFGDLVARSMVLGQNATTLLYDNFRLSIHLDTVAASTGNLTISSPRSDFERLSNTAVSEVKLSPATSNPNSSTVALKLIAVYPRSYSPDTSAFVSRPLILQVQAQDGTDSADPLSPDEYLSNVEFTFQHNEPQYEYLHSMVVNFTTVCTKRNESELHSFVCPKSGQVLIHNCSQGAGVHTSYCHKPAPGCAKLGVDSADITAFDGCHVVSYNLTYTVCSCPIRVANGYHQQRYLATAEEGLLDSTGATNMMVSTVFIAENFADTFSAADDFNSPSDASKVLVVIVMLGVLWVPALLFLGVDWLQPAKMKPLEGPSVKAEAQRSVAAYIDSTIPGIFDPARSHLALLWSELLSHHDLFRLLGKQSKQQRRLAVGKMLTVLTFLLFLTAVFFDVSNPGDDGSCPGYTTSEKCLKRTSPFDYDQTYCQWIHEVTEKDEVRCSYATQSLSGTALFYLTVLTTIITAVASIPIEYLFGIISAPTAQSLKGSKMMNVIQAAVNGARRLSNVGIRVATSAEAPKAVPTVQTIKPRMSSLRAASLSMLTTSAEDKVIASREIPEEFTQASNAARASIALIEKNSKAIMQRSSNAAVSLKARSTKRMSQLRSGKQDAGCEVRAATTTGPNEAKLSSEVIEQRMLMNDGADETVVFDAQWGVLRSIEGGRLFLFTDPTQAIEGDVASAQEEAEKLSEVLPNYSVHHAGLEILHLFMVDLLGRNTPAAKIFQEKFGEEFGGSQVVVMAQKYAAAILLLCLNGFFAYYILLKAFQKGYEWQIQYLVCSLVQFVVELLVFETTECVWLNYSVPLFVHKEVAVAAQKLREHVNHVVAPSDELALSKVHTKTFFLNAPPRLFVSAQVAQHFPNMLESMIVRSYADHLPGEIYRTWPHSKSRVTHPRQHREHNTWMFLPASLITSATLTLNIFMTIPYLYQRVAIRFVQPMLFSGISMVWFAAVQSTTSIIVLSAVSAAALLYLLWRQYRKTVQMLLTVVPVTVDHSRPEDTVVIDIRPIPTFIDSEGDSSSDDSGDESLSTSMHVSTESSNSGSEDESDCDSQVESGASYREGDESASDGEDASSDASGSAQSHLHVPSHSQDAGKPRSMESNSEAHEDSSSNNDSDGSASIAETSPADKDSLDEHNLYEDVTAPSDESEHSDSSEGQFERESSEFTQGSENQSEHASIRWEDESDSAADSW